MSFHLAHPSITTTGKQKGPRKFRNSASAQKSRVNQDTWSDLLKKYGIEKQQKKRQRALTAEVWKPQPLLYRGSDQPRIPSVETSWEPCTKTPDKVYTGTKMLGISQMAKSNAVPVFNIDHIIEIARMRR